MQNDRNDVISRQAAIDEAIEAVDTWDGVRNHKDVTKTGEHYPLDEFLKELE